MKITRRDFVAMLGAGTLASIGMPGVFASSPASTPAIENTPAPANLPSAESNPLADRIRRLIGMPTWDDSHTLMLWVEESEDSGEATTMMWTPTTAKARADAEEFYAAATWRSWATDEELQKLLESSGQNPGPWLVRLNLCGHFLFAVTSDPERVSSDDSEEEDILSNDPADGALMNSREALVMIRRLTESWDLSDSEIYFEPVRPAEACIDQRLSPENLIDRDKDRT